LVDRSIFLEGLPRTAGDAGPTKHGQPGQHKNVPRSTDPSYCPTSTQRSAGMSSLHCRPVGA
jgi:hypothetical protein